MNNDRNESTASNPIQNEVDIDPTHDKNQDGAKEKIFSFEITDESGSNELQYCIKLFTSNGRNQSVTSAADMHHLTKMILLILLLMIFSWTTLTVWNQVFHTLLILKIL